MNKARREELEKALGLLHDAQEIIETCRDEEQDYLDSMPESFQGGEKGSMAESAIENMESAMNGIEEALSGVESAQE